MKEVLLNIIDYMRYQVANDKCTPTQLRSIHDSIVNNVKMEATVADLAEYYGQSESNVRNVLARNFMPKPKRRIYYSFLHFIKYKPASWKRKKTETDK